MSSEKIYEWSTVHSSLVSHVCSEIHKNKVAVYRGFFISLFFRYNKSSNGFRLALLADGIPKPCRTRFSRSSGLQTSRPQISKSRSFQNFIFPNLLISRSPNDLQIARSPDLSISRSHNLQISRSPDLHTTNHTIHYTIHYTIH